MIEAAVRAAVRAAGVPPFHAMAMAREAAALEASGRRMLHLEVGQPSTPLPAIARDAVRAHLDEPLGYTNAAGLQSLRRRLADRYDGVAAERVLVVAGASAGFTLAFLTLFEPGARVGVMEPGYPCYRNALLALGMEPVAIAVGPETRWAPTPAHLEAAGDLDGLVLASPSNPTGTVLSADALADITTACRARGITVIADEIYHGIVDGPPAARTLDHHPEAFVVNSFSKYWSMTGWRVGWVVVPDSVVDTVERLQQNLYICAPHVSQVAALAALDATEELDGHVARYRTSRSIVIGGLAAAGITDIAPADGAFYVYAHVPHLTTELGIDSLQLTARWLHELGVAATSGIDFDLARGHEYVRFSYAGAGADLAEACELLAGWTP
jgi:aspartate/methionine/tyrosine aminotransferase